MASARLDIMSMHACLSDNDLMSAMLQKLGVLKIKKICTINRANLQDLRFTCFVTAMIVIFMLL